MSNNSPQVEPVYTAGGLLYLCHVYESSVPEYLYRAETTNLDVGAPEMVEMKFDSLDAAEKFADTVAKLKTRPDAQEMIDVYTKD